MKGREEVKKMTSETRFHSGAFSCQKKRERREQNKKRADIIKAEIMSDVSELLRGDTENKALGHP